MEPWRAGLYSWLKGVTTEPGHGYLYAPCRQLLRLFAEDTRSTMEIEEFVSHVAACVAGEVDFGLKSYERAIPFICMARPCDRSWRMSTEASFSRTVDLVAMPSSTERLNVIRPALVEVPITGSHYACGGRGATNVTRCYELLSIVVDVFEGAGMRTPCVRADVAEVLLQPFRPGPELHVGHGAFIAYFGSRASRSAIGGGARSRWNACAVVRGGVLAAEGRLPTRRKRVCHRKRLGLFGVASGRREIADRKRAFASRALRSG